MNNILSILLIGISLLQVNARQLISENPAKAMGNMFPYEPMDSVYTPAPEGYTAFYISHIGRHGSRYATDSTNRFSVLETLDKYRNKGMLTDEGERLYQDILTIKNNTAGHFGMLSERGAREHREIADRMYRNFPEVFRSGGHIDTYTTTVPRVVESRDNFLSTLQKHDSSLKFSLNYANESDWNKQEVSGRSLNKEEMAIVGREDKLGPIREEMWKQMDPSAFNARIFKDPSKVGNTGILMYHIRNAVKAHLCMDGQQPDMISWFTPDELYNIWWRANIVWYARQGITEDNQGIKSDIKGRLMAEAIIEDARQAIKSKGKTVATLRFSHDTELQPLLCFLNLEGSVCTDLRDIAEQARDFENILTAANLQIIFYHNAKGNVIVKILKNEKECGVVGVKAFDGPYYNWKDVRKFWENRTIR